jgi:hypothetical protein
MKKLNPKFSKAVLGTVAASITVSSCYNGHIFDDSLYGEFAENSTTKGLSVIDIRNSNLSDEFIRRSNIINDIINNILSNRSELVQFTNDQEKYLLSKELELNIELADYEKKLLIAFNDDEVIRAVKENNIESFLRICKEKEYIGVVNEKIKSEDLQAMFKTEEDYDNFLKMIDAEIDDDGYIVQVVGVVALPVVVVAYMYLGAVTIAGVAVAAYAAAALSGPSVNGERSISSHISKLLENEPVLRIWTDNNGVINSDVFYSEVIDKQVYSFREFIEKAFPETRFNKAIEIFRIQLEGYYGLRE